MAGSIESKTFKTMNKQNNWSLTPNGKGLFILTLEGPEGTDKLWIDQDELIALKQYLNVLDLPLENDLPL